MWPIVPSRRERSAGEPNRIARPSPEVQMFTHRVSIVAVIIAVLSTAVGCRDRPGTNVAAAAAQQAPVPAEQALIARAKSLELATPYVPPPGDPLVHPTAGFAKIMCSAVFIAGLDPD